MTKTTRSNRLTLPTKSERTRLSRVHRPSVCVKALKNALRLKKRSKESFKNESAPHNRNQTTSL